MRFLTVLLVIFANMGCATTTAEMKTAAPWQVWIVDSPIEETFRAYKDFAEAEMSGGDILWAEGTRTKAYFYGRTAELSLVLENNAFGKGTYLHFELEQQDASTRVKVWPFSRQQEKDAEKFKALLPTSEAGTL